MIFVGVDWAEAHNDVLVMDEAGGGARPGALCDRRGRARPAARPGGRSRRGAGRGDGRHRDRSRPGGRLARRRRLPGLRRQPLAASRYRDRHTTSGAKSDAGDAKLLADLVRTDRHNHRPLAGDSDEASAIRVLARAHQGLVWMRQRQVNGLRSALRDYFPAPFRPLAPTWPHPMPWRSSGSPRRPSGPRLSRAKIAAALRRAGRERNLERRAAEIQAGPARRAAPGGRCGGRCLWRRQRGAVAVLVSLNAQIAELEARAR